MTVTPKDHFINWQQDPFSNYLGRLVFPEKTSEFEVEIDLVADMIIINPLIISWNQMQKSSPLPTKRI